MQRRMTTPVGLAWWNRPARRTPRMGRRRHTGPRPGPKQIKPGMTVKTPQANLDDSDISRAHVQEVIRDDAGNVQDVVVEKGVVFRKDIVVPADRITQVKPAARGKPGEVVVDAREGEFDSLSAVGKEELATEREARVKVPHDVLGEAEEALPTAEGQRQREGQRRRNTPLPPNEAALAESVATPQASNRFTTLLRALGPGFLAGMAGNDASAVTSYSVNGATNGFGQLWLMLLSTPMFQAVQFACGKVGRVSQTGLADLLRQRYGMAVAVPATLILVVANVGLIAGDLVAIGSGLELITGIDWLWFVLAAALFLWYMTVFQNFETIKKVFLGMSLAFLAYLITGFMVHPHWGEVLSNTFVPHLG